MRLHRGGNFGFPTGRTMDPIYERLAALNVRSPIDPEIVNAFMVDEYVGLKADDPSSYTAYVTERVFNPLRIKQFHTVTENGYDEKIESLGGIDLQILGLGHNGHIGFNEPGSAKNTHTRLVKISESTREANSALFNSLVEVPTHAVSIGVGTILNSKEVWVIATGASKAEIVLELSLSSETAVLPASFLKSHPNCSLVLDMSAASKLKQ